MLFFKLIFVDLFVSSVGVWRVHRSTTLKMEYATIAECQYLTEDTDKYAKINKNISIHEKALIDS